MNDLIPGLFSFKGRMSRAEFWLLLIALSFVSGGLLLVGSMIVLAIAPPGADIEAMKPLHAAARAVLQLATLWPTLAILTKRGHDRNRPAALSIGLWVGATVAGTLGAFAPALFFVWLAIALYLIVDYGFLPGTPGRNRYDVDGKSRSAAHDVLKAASTFE